MHTDLGADTVLTSKRPKRGFSVRRNGSLQESGIVQARGDVRSGHVSVGGVNVKCHHGRVCDILHMLH